MLLPSAVSVVKESEQPWLDPELRDWARTVAEKAKGYNEKEVLALGAF
jgi:hypothetical protein